MRVCVIGAGVIGITSAVAVQEAFPLAEVTIVADAFSPETTGDGSAGYWGPYILGKTDPQKILRWALQTHKWMEKFWKSDLAADVGVSLIPCYHMNTALEEKPIWNSIVYGFHEFNENHTKQLTKLQNKFQYSQAWHFLTYTMEPAKFLPWLMERFKLANGKIVKRKVTDFETLKAEGYDIIINCAGLGNRQLVNDHLLKPVRGQVLRVKAPWMFEVISEGDDDGNYIIPNIDTVVLGGTHQEGDHDVSVREEDTKFIHEGCKRLRPSLDKCKIVKKWVGLRPGREELRLESEIINTPGRKDCMIIHNYGHGGSGVTLSWGCALDVVEIIRQRQKAVNPSKL